MQHRYFGDVGDYGKYGLLRALSGLSETPHLRLGVVWYLYPDESHNQDGKHLGYLHDPTYRECDEALYDSLRANLIRVDGALIDGSRHLDTLSAMGMLPPDTLYYPAPLSYPAGLSIRERRRIRQAWFEAALAQTAAAELVFVDPDNGLECASVTRFSCKGPKYVYWDDIQAFIARGQSLIIYHHLNRSGPHSKQVAALLEQMRERFPENEPMALRFRRGSARAYFILASASHRAVLSERLTRLGTGNWKEHFIAEPLRPADGPQTG